MIFAKAISHGNIRERNADEQEIQLNRATELSGGWFRASLVQENLHVSCSVKM